MDFITLVRLVEICVCGSHDKCAAEFHQVHLLISSCRVIFITLTGVWSNAIRDLRLLEQYIASDW